MIGNKTAVRLMENRIELFFVPNHRLKSLTLYAKTESMQTTPFHLNVYEAQKSKLDLIYNVVNEMIDVLVSEIDSKPQIEGGKDGY